MAISLIPCQPGQMPGYWCTWGLQNYLAATTSSNAFGFMGHAHIASVLTEENLKQHAFDLDFLRQVRKDLFVVYDVGWDVPLEDNFDKAQWLLGSQIVAIDKFPSCTGTPAERLTKLNKLTKEAGWRGAGLWIPAHAFGEGKDGSSFTSDELAAFFRERLKWSQQAGIEYWKVDYGRHCGEAEFRKMLTELGKEEAPGLLIEHARNGGPLNDAYCPWDTSDVQNSGSFARWGSGSILKAAVEMIGFSDVFRTYDVSYMLSVPTTLDRVAQLLKAYSGLNDKKCILNCESEPYIGAVLGCAIGVMSSAYASNIMTKSGEDNQSILDQFARALRWQRLAPAWGVGEGETLADTEVLTDTWDFRKGSDWVDYLDGKPVPQSAPARISRNMPLPVVETTESELPYVICSRHANGAVAVASLPRVSVEKGKHFPRCRATIAIGDGQVPIAVFGQFEQVCLKFGNSSGDAKRVWAQDLLKDEAVDITDRVVWENQTMVLSGSLIDTLGGTSTGPEDSPGLVIQIR